MAVTFTGAGTAQNATSQTSVAVTTATAFAVGDMLVALMAYDNSGGGGADPMSGTIALSGGYTGASVSAQTGINDPGAASAGLAARCVCFPVTTAIPTSTSITVSWSGNAVAKAVVFMKVSSAAVTSYRTNHGATGTNTVNLANATAFVTPSVNSGEGVLCWTAEENGIALTGDADTTNGTWGAIYGTFNATTAGVGGMAAYMQAKVVTATATQTFNPTGNATLSDWITGCLIFTETPIPAITQASYRVYDDGTETGAVALAAQDTAANGDDLFGDAIGQLRVRLQSTNAGIINSTDDWQLQWEKNSSGSWSNVSSTAILFDSYQQTAGVSGFALDGGGGTTGLAQSVLGQGNTLTQASFWMAKFGTPPGTITARLYAMAGVYGSTGVPTGSALASSTSIAATAVSGTAAWVDFTFDGTFTMVDGTAYCIVVELSVIGTGSNFVSVYFNTAAPVHGGNRSSLSFGAWGGASSSDFLFRITGVTAVVPYASPNTTDGAVTTNRLGAGTGSFVAGKISETGLVTDLGWSSNNYTELLFPLAIKKAAVVAGDVIRFRVLRNGVTTGMTYTVTPTVNVVESTITQASYRVYDDGTETGAVALAAQDTAANGDITSGDGIGQLRVRLQSTSVAPPAATDDWQLQWERNASGTWTNVVRPVGILESYPSTNWSTAETLDNSQTQIVQSFLGDGRKLTRYGGYGVRTGGSPATGTLTAVLYAHTGTFGSSGKPTGSILATSTTSIALSAVNTSNYWLYFDFDGTFTLTSGTPYCIGVRLAGNTGVGLFQHGVDGSSPTHPGNVATLISSTWGEQSEDLIFEVYTGGVTPPTTVVSYASPNTTDGAATTNRLGAGSGSFVAGKISEAGLVSDLGWTANNYTELLYPVAIKKPDVLVGDVIRFRVLRNGVTTGMTYTAVPTVNVIKGVENIPATITTTWSWTATADGTVTTPGGGGVAPTHLSTSVEIDSTTVDLPLGTSGILALFATSYNDTAVVTGDSSPPAVGTWTLRQFVAHTTAHDGTNGPTATWVWTKPAEGGDPATFTWTTTTVGGTGGSYVETSLSRYTHPDGIPVVNAVATPTQGRGTGTGAVPAVTTTAANAVIVAGKAGYSKTVSAPPAGYTQRANYDTSMYVWDAPAATAGTYGPTSYTNSGEDAFTNVAIALSPPSVGPVDWPGTISTTWGGWTATAVGVLNRTATVSTSWGTLVATAVGTREVIATVSMSWGTWTATALGTVSGPAAIDWPGTISSNWGAWTATSIATVNRPATVATSWGTWSATAVAGVNRPATVTTTWSAWTATATALRTAYAAISTTWGQWSATALAAVEHPATISASWGTWTATATGTVTTGAANLPGTISSNWGAWTATSTATVTRPSTISTSWGTWAATSTAVVTRSATISTNWGTWAAFGVAAPDKVATISTSWGTWTATGTATVNHPATISTTWAWTATATAGVIHPATISTTWSWIATATAGVNRPATISTTWAWSATSVATVNRFATVSTTWSAWTATATASLNRSATISTSWGTWTATAVGATLGQVSGIISTTWSWTATAVAKVARFGTISTTWTWAATATGVVNHPATISSTWAWSATAIATATRPATVTTSWGTWTATAVAKVERPATISTSWGTWSATAVGSLVGGVSGTITTTWGPWTATAVASRSTTGSITSNWGGWVASGVASVQHPATITTVWGGWAATAVGTLTVPAIVTTDWGTWTATAVGQRTVQVFISTVWGAWTATAIGSTGVAIGVWNDGVTSVGFTEMMYGPDRVVEWMMAGDT